MPAISATAPGKAILVGEHAVVYGRPAIAVPVTQIRAKASVFAEIRGKPGDVWVEAPEIRLSARLSELPPANAFARLFAAVARELSISHFPALRLNVTSTIPIAAGLGSGAAVSIATLRALSAFLGHPLPDERVSALAFEQEKLFHGTPSGIDNAVITYAQPLFFLRDQPFELLTVSQPFTLVIADTGIRSSTAAAVSGVRLRWQADMPHYDSLFDRIADVVIQAHNCLETGDLPALGALMDKNHALLQQIGVSCPDLDRLVDAARQAGAWGAKLSGGGQGGNMIALVDHALAEQVVTALRASGAVRTWVTQVKPKLSASAGRNGADER
jgi:mevalonate kinase